MQVRFSKGMRKASVGVAVEVSVSNRTSGINTRSLRSGMQALLWFFTRFANVGVRMHRRAGKLQASKLYTLLCRLLGVGDAN